MKKPKYLKYYIGIISYIFFSVGAVLLIFKFDKERVEPIGPIERESIDYIVENLELFEEDINQLGYEIRVADTLGDIWTEHYDKYPDNYDKNDKLGYLDRGLLVLYKENEEYCFDTGFAECKIDINKDTVIELQSIPNIYDYEPIDLEKTKNYYPIRVTVENDNIKYTNLSNVYDVDFVQFLKKFRDEYIYDARIKEYISAEELREIFDECMYLQTQLIKLYEEELAKKAQAE